MLETHSIVTIPEVCKVCKFLEPEKKTCGIATTLNALKKRVSVLSNDPLSATPSKAMIKVLKKEFDNINGYKAEFKVPLSTSPNFKSYMKTLSKAPCLKEQAVN